MKILLIDDHLLFLDGLAQLLALKLERFNILKASSVRESLYLAQKHSDIDLALVDLSMPDAGGIEFIEAMSHNESLLPIAVLSACEDSNQIRQVMNIGVLGFIPKSYGVDALLNAINHILAGQVYLPEHIKLQLNQQEKVSNKNEVIAQEYDITPRQLEVLSLLAQGLANRKIAYDLNISEHTVKSHIKQLFQKLDSNNRTACIHQAKLLGILV